MAKTGKRYVLSEAFAAGATATVHLGRRSPESDVVAVKRLHPHLARSKELRAILVEEARLASRIAHPNVVQIVEVVEEEEEVLVVMEYLRGETLERLLTASPSTAIVVAIVRDVLHGLHAAHHARGRDGKPLEVVHRDVNPRNVLVTIDGTAKVLDFGIAKARGRTTTTRDGYTRGTLPYMAPEQVRGEALTSATDIRAAGVLLWEGLTGKRLFAGENEAAITKLILDEDVAPPSTVDETVPRVFDAVVAKALARDPADRYATALEMALALETALAPAPRDEVGAWVMETARDALSARSRDAAKLLARARRPGAWGTAALVAAALGLALLLFAIRGSIATHQASASDSPTAPATVPSPMDAPPPVESTDTPPPASSPEAAAPPTATRWIGPVPAKPPPPPTAASSAPPKEPCLPYFIDDAGHRRFNRDCLK